MGTFIGGQEYYYPRPDTLDEYALFREGYEEVVKGLVGRYVPDPVGEGWEGFVRDVREAVGRFFEKFEGVYEEKTEFPTYVDGAPGKSTRQKSVLLRQLIEGKMGQKLDPTKGPYKLEMFGDDDVNADEWDAHDFA